MPRPPVLIALLAALAVGVAACGSDSESDEGSSEPAGTTAGTTVTDASLVEGCAPTALPVPEVQVPPEVPTELVITDVTVGEGHEAAAGDTVVVDYVGVVTADGEPFDNSYERGVPFDVTLGRGGVIPGWEQGLIGVQTGGRRQLDIPADLAYGDAPPPGSPIEAGDALTFLVDVRAVIPAADPADAPRDLQLEPSEGATDTTFEDVVVGDGPAVEECQTAVVHMLLVRGDNQAILFDTWEAGEPFQIVLVDGGSLPGLIEGLEGMRVGGQRVITMPPDEAFGPEGNTELGLPGTSDLVVVAELVGRY